MATVTIDPKEYALRLKEAAGEAGIYSARELARLLDVQEQTVKQWYSGNSRPNGKNLTNLLAILRVDNNWLQHGRRANDTLITPVHCVNPVEDFRAALAVISGMGELLSEKTMDITRSDANKIGRAINKAANNADRAFQALADLYSEQSK
ncbi:MAG: helix-turn-helix transcriptional regulator [Gammaproteobacteria bacterium]|nr:helix-turn-helix transcriptional regulator [Gammaproteobacteria bacterium]MCP5406194.1 helix-turn-helix transcriptional regulator [Chromatiaceae bacterium]MCP5409702.1 helix-turn-helix transcriptional regulator [Chromatiaceae bacterium]MCP5442750.1 helix-turn-helix transcriptional regulator [Chromatiaceae bacterium]